MIARPDPTLTRYKHLRYSFLRCEKVLNQISIDQLAVMLSLLRLYKNLLFKVGTLLKSNIYDDILLLSLFKLNQYQLCSKTRDLIFKAIVKMFPSRTKLTFGQPFRDSIKSSPI